MKALLESFLVPDSRERIARKVAVCRCLFGALVAWRFAHVYGFSVVADDPMQVRWYAGVGAVLGAAICVGLLSQVCLCLLALVFLVQAPFASTLGDQVALLTAYGLILAGSSEAWAVDRIVLPRCASPLSRKLLRLFALPFTPESFACLRVALIALFWGICFTAMSFHFLDELWARSRVLHLLFTMPYMSSLYPWMSRAAESAPVLYDFLCRTALWAQGAWELFLLPLMFWRWGRLFAKWQGLAFFLVSAVGINLDYLPFTELVFWLLVFNYRVPRTVAAPSAPVPLLPKALAWGGLGVALSYALVIGGRNLSPAGSVRKTFDRLAHFRLYRALGQSPVDVFNREDMSMGRKHFVLVQTTEEGKPVRTVPLTDLSGGRLGYLRNSVLYFDHSLRWQRLPFEAVLSESGPSDYTLDLLGRYGRLDACLRRVTETQHYTAVFFKTEIVEDRSFPSWAAPAPVGKLRFRISEAQLGGLPGCRQSFRLPPGFYWEKRRLGETLDWARVFLADGGGHS